jgi:DUF4097 and DUF4098 domain-containing protein YvlB
MQRVWIVVGSIVTVVVLAGATLNAIGLVAREEVTVTDELDATGVVALDLRASNGSVEVIGTDTDVIRLTVELTHGLRPTGHRAEVDGDRLVVRSSCPLLSQWCDADYRLEVPSDLAVRVHVDDGRITVRDIDGPVDADGDNGTVELTRLSGDVVASTENGSVVATGLRSEVVDADGDNGSVRLSFAEPPRDVEATTDNGSVEVVVPDDDTTYLVDIDSRHGSTDIGVRTDPDSDRLVRGRTQNGNVTVRYPTG